MPVIGEKSPEYPFGYGYCACGCGKVTEVVCGVPLKYFRRLHNPRAVEIDRESARQRARGRETATERALRVQLSAQMMLPRGEGWLDSPEAPPVKRPTLQAIAKRQKNARLAQAVAWTKANPDFIKWHRKKLGARSAETAKRYQRERRTRDPVFKLAANMRGRIGAVLKKRKRDEEWQDGGASGLLNSTVKRTSPSTVHSRYDLAELRAVAR